MQFTKKVDTIPDLKMLCITSEKPCSAARIVVKLCHPKQRKQAVIGFSPEVNRAEVKALSFLNTSPDKSGHKIIKVTS